MRKPKLLLFLTFVLVMTIAALSYAFSRQHAATLAASGASTAWEGTSSQYLRRGRLSPRLRDALGVLGDRLEKPGKERLTANGTMTQAAGGSSVPFALALEFPGRLRLTLGGASARTITYNERADSSARHHLSPADDALIETLAYDTPERFFSAQAGGVATRFLGSRFRLDDGTDSSYPGPYYDLYQVTDYVRQTGAHPLRRTKLYYVNSDTLLLERVKYTVMTEGGNRVMVEVVLSDWRQVAGQVVPGQIVRTEDGQVVLTLTLDSVKLGPRGDASIFAALPQ